MERIDADDPPKHTDEVLVSDGSGGFAVAWFRASDKTWHAAVDMLEAENCDGFATIKLSEKVRCWMTIQPSPIS